MARTLYVYIMGNRKDTVLYTGVTGDLARRVWQHKNKRIGGFTSRYNVTKLLYYEPIESPFEAVAREKQIKSWRRTRKEQLIRTINPEWEDLAVRLFESGI